MSQRAGSHSLLHGRRWIATAKLLAAFLAFTSGAVPMFVSWHEAVVQHVRCFEHGELTHVDAGHVHRSSVERAGASLQSEENAERAHGHEHCEISFVVQGAAHAPTVRAAVRFTPPPAAVQPRDTFVARPVRARVWASAPKTSPPVA